jgi:hypothetical protein
MVTSAAKHDLDEISFVQEIQQLGLPKENADAVARQYREHKDTLRDRFALESYRISQLISTDWRVDQIVASSIDEPLECTIQLMMKINQRPHDKLNGSNADQNGKTLSVTCEMPVGKLDVLIHELSNAQTLMESLHN